MKFNAQKCYIPPTKARSSFLYSLGGVILKQVQQDPYLGVNISADLKRSTHISDICKRAGLTLGFLQRNLWNCPQECRCLAYISLIRSSLEYGATVWDPYLKQDVDRLERVHHHAAWFIKRDYRTRETGCVGHMLQELNLPPLQERRKQRWLTTLYKIVEGHIPAMPPENFLTPADRNQRRIRPTTFKDCSYDKTIARQEIWNSSGLKIPDSKIEQCKNSFFVRTVADWIKLEDTVVTADSVSVTAFSSAVGRALQRGAPRT